MDKPFAERLGDMAKRCGDLSPLAAPVRRIVEDDNREAILSGQDCRGHAVSALAPSTLERRDGSGPPRAPHGMASRLVAGLVVVVHAGLSRLAISKTWPDAPWWVYHASGTRNMPARDPSGVRPEATARVRELLSKYIMKG